MVRADDTNPDGTGRTAPIDVGDSLPDIDLIDHDGQPWRLSEYRGRPILLIAHRHLA